MRRSLIFDVCVGKVFHTALAFSLFLLFAGHNAPGGGFVGGLVAAAAFVLRYVGGGSDEVRRLVRMNPAVILGSGLVLANATGIGPWLTGGEFLESAKATLDVPVLGAVHLTSALAFDVGVYLVVVGLLLTVLETLGGEASL